MKRSIAMILSIVLCLGLLSACGGDEKSGSGSLQVGFGKADVTPTESIPLDGYSGADSAQYRRSTATEWPFYAICVAFTDANNNTVMLATLDMLNAYMADSMRDAISGETGVPKSNIMFHVTHNHSGPSLRVDHPAVNPYISQLTGGVLAAAKAAMADRKPAQSMQTTFTRVDKTNTVRHYLLADGSYQSYGVGNVPKDQLIGHYSQVDNLLQLVKFTREGGKDVVMVNWQGHPPGTSPNTIATSNYPGVLRNYLDTNLNCDSIFLLGGSGNINNNSQIKSDIDHDGYQQLGEKLGAAAVEAATNFTQRDVKNIILKEKEILLDTRDGGAKKVWLYAISLGEFALVTAPFEIFDTNAVAVREDSQFPMTFYLSCCNGSNGYLPTPPSYGWEITYESRIAEFPEGTAEIVQNDLTAMVSEVFVQTGLTEKEKQEGYIHKEFVPTSDGVTYRGVDPGNTTLYSQVKNDFYAFQMLTGSQIKNFLCKDAALVERILAKDSVQLIFDVQNVVVGMVE